MEYSGRLTMILTQKGGLTLAKLYRRASATHKKGLTIFRKSLNINMVVGDGFEPSKAELTDLQSVPFDRSGTPPPKSSTNILIIYSARKPLF